MNVEYKYEIMEVEKMKREKLKSKIEELMGQYDREEIDGDTYMNKMMNLTAGARDLDDEDDDED